MSTTTKKQFRKYAKKQTKRIVKRKPNPWAAYLPAFPYTRKVSLKYSEYANMQPATSILSSYAFKINSLFDPNQSGVGDQPRYFDELCGSTLYKRYQVDAVKYKVTFINKGTTDALASVAFRNTLTVTGGATAENHFHMRELTRTKQVTLLANDNDRSRATFEGVQKIWPILCRTESDYHDDATYQGSYAADPSGLAYMILYGSDNPQDVSGANIDWYVELTFYCSLFERADIVAQS